MMSRSFRRVGHSVGSIFLLLYILPLFVLVHVSTGSMSSNYYQPGFLNVTTTNCWNYDSKHRIFTSSTEADPGALI